MKPLVIYHGNCADGFTAAWCCWRQHSDWEFYPGVYSNEPPDCTGRDVYFLDFCYKRAVMEKICTQANTVTVLDHHKTAMDDCGDIAYDNITLFFNMERSGAMMSYLHFYPGYDHSVESFVKYVQDRDLWKFEIPYTQEVNEYIFSFKYSFENWNYIKTKLSDDFAGAVDEGRALLRMKEKNIEELINVTTRFIRIGGYEVPVANLPYIYVSEAANLLCKIHDSPFAACYWDTPEGRVFGLRSLPDGADVSDIAKLYGGGGHKHAAGFRTPYGSNLG